MICMSLGNKDYFIVIVIDSYKADYLLESRDTILM